jgi:hypothetical protein
MSRHLVIIDNQLLSRHFRVRGKTAVDLPVAVRKLSEWYFLHFSAGFSAALKPPISLSSAQHLGEPLWISMINYMRI